MKKIIINSQDIIHNLNAVRSRISNAQLIAVLKGNGYGLGVQKFAALLVREGVYRFAVTQIEEAQAIRGVSLDCQILLLSPTSEPEIADKIVRYGVTATLSGYDSIAALNAACERAETPATAHIKIDTGFGRYGFMPDDARGIFDALRGARFKVSGIYSHFSNAFGKNLKSCHKQFKIFNDTVDALTNMGMHVGERHIANSCAALRDASFHLDAVRIGSALLGRLPVKNEYGLRRVAQMQSRVTHIATLPAGHNVGYGNTYKTKRAMRVAVIPVGYADGFGVQIARDVFRFKDILRYVYGDLRCFGKKLYVNVQGHACPLVGRVCMKNIEVIVPQDVTVGAVCELDCNALLADSAVIREWI